ncbi:glycosyltransferase [Glutamicibacter sp.]|uniref:glycosyltransferase n=1 Tax=Glutamicibacter sp. TaxID=1931995 RepID=UPI0028BE5AC7|nr:glycosyltransferase [Glutamicibacter sp.]
MNTAKVSVVICAYTERRWKELVSCVRSVQNQSTASDEILLVIDHNPELLSAAQAEFSGVKVLASTGPKGLSGARNTGVAVCTGDIIVFLDDDASAESTWLEELLAPYADPKVLGVGGAAMPVWESGEPSWWPAEFGWVIGCSYTGQPAQRSEIRNLMGCNMSVRREVFDAVGGFNPELGRAATGAAGCEETELCLRARNAFPQGMFIHEPRAVVHHQVPAQRAAFRYFRERCYAEGLSKSYVARTLGSDSALSAERAYTTKVLPAGVLRNAAQLPHRGLAGPATAAAIVAGLATTAAGYVVGSIKNSSAVPVLAPVPPVLPVIVDVAAAPAYAAEQPLPDGYESALCLVTENGGPLAKMSVDLNSLPSATLWQLQAHVREHYRAGRLGEGIESPALPTTEAAVVIATRNRPLQLAQCLDSLDAGTYQPSQIIVVDNNPSDAETELMIGLRSMDDPRLMYVRENRPGLAHAHNAALEHITAPIVAFTDDDVLADQHWLASIVRVFEEDPDAACVTGLIAPRELDTLAQQWVEGNQTYDKGLERRSFQLPQNSSEAGLLPYASGACGSGANMSFRTSYIVPTGFDVSLGVGTVAMGGDDLAAFYDVLASGNKLVYEPAAVVLHPHYRDVDALQRQMYGYGAGLGAHLTRCLLRDPKMLLRFAGSSVSLVKRTDEILRPSIVDGLPPMPRALLAAHRRGIVSGPVRYLRSSYRVRRAQKAAGQK